VIATDPGTITRVQGVGFPYQKPGSLHLGSDVGLVEATLYERSSSK
jgi:hypothetical protein